MTPEQLIKELEQGEFEFLNMQQVKDMYSAIEKVKNPSAPFVLNGKEFKEGDKVSGRWFWWNGMTYEAEGVIKNFPSGAWVDSEGASTEVKLFYKLTHV